MKIKKYVVNTMPEALQKIRADLGSNAVIINTKEVRTGGFLGMFTKKKVEVVAAADSEPEVEPIRRKPDFARLEPRLEQGRRAYAENPPAKEDQLLKEIRQMKEMMQRIAAASPDWVGSENEAVMPAVFRPFYDALRQRDVRDELAADIIKQAAGRMDGDVTEDQAKEAVKEVIASMLLRLPVELIRPESRIVYFVGPTGVGKTTTIAKIAADLKLRQKKEIALVTSDTYRIAAVEQLRTYASILDVPLEVVFTPMELGKTIERMTDKDVILMDTAGRNFRSEMAVSELHSLFRAEEKKDLFLVLSLSMKYSDMKKVAENFHALGLEKVLFTKADETDTLGSIVNLLHDFPLSLSYITNGQDVPDDIVVADPYWIAEQLVGESYEE